MPERRKIMQYSICSFSQAEITKFNDNNPDYAIDPTDIIIFQWFKDFIVDTVTKKIDNKNYKGMWTYEIDNITYFNIRYEAIIDAFPILKFQSLKSIQRRFDKYVKGGILLKKTVSHGKKGLFTYFSLTDLFKSFYMDKSNPEQKINPHKVEEITQKDEVALDKNVLSKNEIDFPMDKNVQSKEVALDKSVLSKTLPLDKNVQSLIYNSSNSLNSFTTSDSSEPSNPSFGEENTLSQDFEISSVAEEADFLETIIKLFGYNPMFNPNPYPVLVHNMTECKISLTNMSEYLEYAYKTLKKNCKQQEKFVSYFYKSFTSEVYMAQFMFEKSKLAKQKEIAKANQIICPVCGCSHNKNDSECPNEECHFPREQLSSPEEITHQKAIYDLRKNDFEKYQEYEQKMTEMFDKYPITIRFVDKTKNTEYLNEVKELENKYLKLTVC